MDSLLHKVSVNLTQRTVTALELVKQLSGDSMTDIINRSIQCFSFITFTISSGGEFYYRPEKDAELKQFIIL